jgi:hypothetical protein
MPIPRRQSIASRKLEYSRLHQLATGMPPYTATACGWRLPWKWTAEDRVKNLDEMRQLWNEHRAEVIAFARKLSGGKRRPWAERFDSQEVAHANG